MWSVQRSWFPYAVMILRVEGGNPSGVSFRSRSSCSGIHADNTCLSGDAISVCPSLPLVDPTLLAAAVVSQSNRERLHARRATQTGILPACGGSTQPSRPTDKDGVRDGASGRESSVDTLYFSVVSTL